MTEWTWHEFGLLRPQTLYDILKLRSDIFVVEQNCVFSDMDGLDPRCVHLCGYEGTTLVAYLRVVPPGLKSDTPALGRLVVAKDYRRRGQSRDAIERGLAHCAKAYPGQTVRAQAQAHLAPFYQSLGFTRSGEEYMEDGIAHVDMRWQSPNP